MSRIVSVLVLLVAAGFPFANSAYSATTEVSCSSKSFRYQFCRVAIPRGVRLIKQFSDAPCQRGRTWGHDRRGIWVDQGCSASFAVDRDRDRASAESARPPQRGGDEIVCRSRKFSFHRCRAPVAGAIRLHRQLSEAPCIRDKTWGHDRRGIWVDKGCSGRFIVAGSPQRDRTVRDRVLCESPSFRYQHCRTHTDDGVRIVKQLSDAPCIRGRTWGYDRSGIWVDDGCAARFETGRRR